MNEQRSKKANQVPAVGYLPWLLIVIGAATYANSLDGPFIFDDRPGIVENDHIRRLWPVSELLSAPQNTIARARPVVSLSLAVNYALGGLDVRGYHLFNIAVHILAALTLFGVVRRTLICERLRTRYGRTSGILAFVCALIWMVHPIQTECVNYISQRTESLMGLFYLLTLYCAIRADGPAGNRWWARAAVLVCALGMASKQVMVTAPVLVLLYDFVFRSESFARVWCRRRALYIGLAATWLILATLMLSFPDTNIGTSAGIGPLDYAMNQCLVVPDYLRAVVWPDPLLLDYGYPEPRTIGEVAPFAALLAVLLAATMVTLAFRPTVGFCGAWFFAILAPTSSVVPIISEVGAERRMYLPLAGLVVVVVISAYTLLRHVARKFRRGADPSAASGGTGVVGWVGISLVTVVTTALAVTTVRRNGDYRSAVSIWQTVVEAMPDNYRGHSSLGAVLYADGRTGEAVAHYHRALAIRPNHFDAHLNLGVALAEQGKTAEACHHYRQALRGRPDDAVAHLNLGIALAVQGETEDAIGHYRQALATNPGIAEAHFVLAEALSEQGRRDEAVRHYRQAVQIKHDFAEAYYKLGLALAFRGNFEEAIIQYRAATEKKPAYAEARYSLGTALAATGSIEEALDRFGQASRCRPSWVAPVRMTAWIRATHPHPDIRRPQEAVRLAEQAADLAPGRNAMILDTLAAAYAADGQFERAVELAQEAATLATARGAERLAEMVRARLQLYKEGRPYVLPQSGRPSGGSDENSSE